VNNRMGKMIALFSLLLLLCSMVAVPNEAEAASEFYGEYSDVAAIKDYGSCGIMQGMAVGSQKLYTAKINSDDTQAFISMTDKDTGDTVKLYNTDAGSYYFTNLGHANDMDVWGFDGKSHLFVATTEKGANAIIRLKRDGNNLTKVASYKLTCDGTDINATCIAITGVSNGVVSFITKTGTQLYRGTLSSTAANATVEMTKLCSISKSKVYIKGQWLDLSDYTNQSISYVNGMLYVPIWADSIQPNRSVIMVFNMDGILEGSTIYPSASVVFRVTSSTYSALYEIEGCGVAGGKLYFNANRRKSASDTNHDAVSEMKDYTFVKLTEPAEYQKFTVQYHANGGSGTMDNTVVPYGVNTKLRSNSFTKNGSKFVGWTCYRTAQNQWRYTNGTDTVWCVEGSQPSGYTKTIYKNTATVAKTSTIDGDVVMMYAQWEPSTYTVRYDANGGSGTMEDTQVTYGTATKLRANAFTRENYMFTGWNAYRTTNGQWNYTNGNGGSGWYAEGSQPESYYKATYNDQHSISKTSGIDGDLVIMYAQWKADGYTVTFKDADGTVLASNIVKAGVVPIAPADPTKDFDSGSHYTFAGWDKELTAPTEDTVYTATYTAASHSYSTMVDQKADCTQEGSVTHICSCGYSYTEVLPVTDHNYTSVVTAPTCTNGGYTTYICEICGDSRQSDSTNAVGHSYESGICSNCGQADPDYVKPVVIPTLTLKAPALEFKDMIKVIAFYTAENTEDVVQMGMVTYKTEVNVIDIATADHVIPGATYDDATGRYFSGSQGIHAKYLGDTVYLACYAKLTDGTYVYTKLAPYSAIDYANSQLKNSTDMNLKQLVASMLNYGAAAQLYFGHHAHTLANASLTGEQKTLPEGYTADMVRAVPTVPAGKQGGFTNNQGFSSRKPAVSFEGAFSINYFFTPAYVPVDGIVLYYWTEADYNAVDVLTTANATGSVKMDGTGVEQYRGDIEGIAAKDLSQAVYVAAVYSDGATTWASGVLGYSIGSYCSSQATKGGTMADLAMATAVYGYHAKQYFG